MTITQDEAVQMAKECGQNWQFYNYRQTTMVTTIEELTAFANLAYQRGLSEANAKAERGELAYEELVEIHRVVMCIGWVKEAPGSDTYTLRAVKQMAMRINESDEKLRAADANMNKQAERMSELERILGGLDHACQLNHSIISEQEARLEGEARVFDAEAFGNWCDTYVPSDTLLDTYEACWKAAIKSTHPPADIKDADKDAEDKAKFLFGMAELLILEVKDKSKNSLFRSGVDVCVAFLKTKAQMLMDFKGDCRINATMQAESNKCQCQLCNDPTKDGWRRCWEHFKGRVCPF